MDKLINYMNSNRLTVNKSKTQLINMSKNPESLQTLKIKDNPKNITPTKNFTYLGIQIDNSLKWNLNLLDSKKSVYRQLNQRLNTLKLARSHMSNKALLIMANGLFYAKHLYGIEVWGNCPKYLRQKLQTLLLKVVRLIIGRNSYWWSTAKILRTASIDDMAKIASVVLAHQMLHQSTPESMAHRITQQRTQATARLSGPNKLGPRPRNFSSTIHTKYHYRAGIYDKYQTNPGD